MFASVELAHFELEFVTAGAASKGEVGRSGVSLLYNVVSDGRVAVTHWSLPLHTDVAGADLHHLQVVRWRWLV